MFLILRSTGLVKSFNSTFRNSGGFVHFFLFRYRTYVLNYLSFIILFCIMLMFSLFYGFSSSLRVRIKEELRFFFFSSISVYCIFEYRM
jgi:hypothetical protein